MIKIIFDNSAKDFILKSMNIKEDDEGYLINDNDKVRIIANDGSYITKEEFGGVTKGSQIIIKENVNSLMKFIERK